MNGFIVWEGESQLNGEPVVMIVTGVNNPSKNTKTGPMLQVFYLLQNEHPVVALAEETDDAVCGDCPLRRKVCYVEVGKSVAAVWRAYRNGKYPKLDLRKPNHRKLLVGRKVRLGAYGDPASVPIRQNRRIIIICAGHTGYSHQVHRFPKLADLVMASADHPIEHEAYQAAGQRTFIVVPEGENPPEDALECLNHSHGIQCHDCMLCDGGQGRNIWIPAHGKGSDNHQWN